MVYFRNLYLKLVEGAKTSLKDLGEACFSFQDVPRETRLIVDDPAAKYISIASLASYTVPLPDGYTNAAYLACNFRCLGRLKFSVVSPSHTTSVAICEATTTYPGYYGITDQVTSITITNPTASTVKLRYILVQLPDLSANASYLRGALTTGVV